MSIPADYNNRVYAGVLGKLIGVYLGRPFENWRYKDILEKLGPITYCVHDRLGDPLVVTDDDVAGTFTFPRALDDYGISPDLSAEDIGKAWMNYIIEERSILWWGGAGNSTEHTAWLNLARYPCPGVRLDRDQRRNCRRTDRRSDLHRRLGTRLSRQPGTGSQARAGSRLRQP